MRWIKSSNVITVTKSVTSVDTIVTRYLLSEKSEGVTVTEGSWSNTRPVPSSDKRYVWAYETYYYTDHKIRNTSPYIIEVYNEPRFEVDFSTDKYEIHPRWSYDSYITFTITKLNGLSGDVNFEQVSSSRGIGLPIYDSITDSYSISIENKSTTATSFSIKIIIGSCIETFTIYGDMIDAESKYIGTLTYLPDTKLSVDGDRCFYKTSDNEGTVYIYDANSESWKAINDSGISNAEKNIIYTEAMKDIISNVQSGSSILKEYGFFDTVISNILKTGAAFVDDLYTKNLLVEKDKFKFEVTSDTVNAIYNGTTIFKINPKNGNIFFGTPNSTLDSPESGFMYNAEKQIITSKNGMFKLRSDGYVEATNMLISGNSEFNGRFDCDVIKTEIKSPVNTRFSISNSNPFHAYNISKMLIDFGLDVNVLHRCSLDLISSVCYCKFSEAKRGYDYKNRPYTEGHVYFYDSNKNQITIGQKTTIKERYGTSVEDRPDAEYIQTYMRTVDEDSSASSYYASLYFASGFTLTITTGGNVLKLSSIPENDAESEGQLYFVLENGKKKLCIK